MLALSMRRRWTSGFGRGQPGYFDQGKRRHDDEARHARIVICDEMGHSQGHLPLHPASTRWPAGRTTVTPDDVSTPWRIRPSLRIP